MKTLKKLLKNVEITKVISSKNIFKLGINGVTTDSRDVKKGYIFIAYVGVSSDGHTYIKEAIKNGASIIIGEKQIEGLSIPYIQVYDGRIAWSQIESNLYDNPEKKLTIIGVTGTDGKTTTVNLIYHLLKTANFQVGMLSTVGSVVSKRLKNYQLHTGSPEPSVLYPLLQKMVKNKKKFVVMETTSHGLSQHRMETINFSIGVLTNITSDHLEYHSNLYNYRESKAKLFERSKKSIINKNSRDWKYFEKKALGKTTLFNKNNEIRNVKKAFENSEFCQELEIKYNNKWLKIEFNIPGEYNLDNLLAASHVASEFKIKPATVSKAISTFTGVKGRFEFVQNNKEINILIDYAHTEQGIKSLLALIKQDLMKKGESLIVVFGCNGDRDRSKRTPMGKVALQYADNVIITNEDPRSENAEQIFHDIWIGLSLSGGKLNKNVFRIDDRYQAIKYAINVLSKKGDWVVCLGKGHEKTIEIKSKFFEWNERAAIEKILQNKKQDL